MDGEFEKIMERNYSGLILFRHLPGGTKVNYKNPMSGESVSRPKFEPGTHWTNVRSVTGPANSFSGTTERLKQKGRGRESKKGKEKREEKEIRYQTQE
jgi:hypothetical protein